MDVNDLAKMAGDACYGFLAINFFWGLYHVIMGFRRVKRFSFKNKQQQAEFLDELMQQIDADKYDEAAAALRGRRAGPAATGPHGDSQPRTRL